MALRFARVVRYRDDKPAAEADTIDTVRALYEGSWFRSTVRGAAPRSPGACDAG
jgi:hypothetical protein